MSVPMFRATAFAAAIVLCAPAMAFATGITITDPYARSSTPTSPTGAAFLLIENNTDTDDRLIAARSDVADTVMLHTHVEAATGVARMTMIEGGIEIPAGQAHVMKRGGDHVMMMGLTRPMVQGEEITITLTFESAGDIKIAVPIDHDRVSDPIAVSVDATN